MFSVEKPPKRNRNFRSGQQFPFIFILSLIKMFVFVFSLFVSLSLSIIHEEFSYRRSNDKTANTTSFFACLKMNSSERFDDWVGDRVLLN